MDFTMLPNEHELAKLRDMLTCVERTEEPKSEQRTGPPIRVNRQHSSFTGRVLGGDTRVTKRRLSVARASISSQA